MYDPCGWTAEALGYISVAGRMSNPKSQGNYGIEYGESCKIGDIVEMVLDFDKLELRYFVNDKDQGKVNEKAFMIEKNTKYRAFVSIYEPKSSVQLL